MNKLQLEVLAVLVVGILFSVLYALLEYSFIHWSPKACYTKYCVALLQDWFWKFKKYHVTMFTMFALVSLMPFVDEVFLLKRFRALYLVIVSCLMYVFIFVEDLMWHVFWWSEKGNWLEFHWWTKLPFKELSIPWWYLLVIPVALVLCIAWRRLKT